MLDENSTKEQNLHFPNITPLYLQSVKTVLWHRELFHVFQQNYFYTF